VLSGDRLRIAIPSKGRLKEHAEALLRQAGLVFPSNSRRLFAVCRETGIGIIFSHAQDIPALVSEGVVDLGITGSDLVREKGVDVIEHRKLGFGRCRLSVAVHVDSPYRAPKDLAGRVVGSKFVRLAHEYFEREGVPDVNVIEIQGAVEVMVLLGLVDAIVEIVETGNSLIENDLRELSVVTEAETVVIGSPEPQHIEERDRLLRRLDGVQIASRYSLVEYNCPTARIEDAKRITPGLSSPTIQNTGSPDWLAVRVMVERRQVQEVMDRLELLGCVAILETELRHARL
jgi:ATP phosphoribosyltransferase